nr:uncharacterized protein LOC126056872 [Helicoverpa armigera]
METTSNDTCDEETLLLNSLLFNPIRKNKRPEEKTAKISKYLSLGADINAVDANNKNNTPLHVAVLKGEIEVVKYLLDHGANASYKNGLNQTALDIAQQLEPTKGAVIINILKSDNDVYQEESQKQIPTITKQINKFQTQSYNTEGIKITTEHFYQKRNGTSGLGGQLYETKLLTLVLLRALHTDSITDFYLGTNVEGVGAFDDIVFRYNVKGNKKPKVIFLQAKHRENPIKDEVTIAEVMKQNGDFSLDKYLESYLKIIRKFSPDNDDNMFKGAIGDIDYIKFFKIRFGEKKHFMCFKDPDMRKVVEKERKAFLDNHKKIGAYFLLAKSVVKDLFSQQEIKEVLEFLDHIKSGEEKSDTEQKNST